MKNWRNRNVAVAEAIRIAQMHRRHDLHGRKDPHFDRQHQRDEDQPEREIAKRKAEVHDRVRRDHRDGDLADRNRQRHDETVEQHAAERRRGIAAALRPDGRDVFEQMRARHQRQRHAEYFVLVHRGRAERDVHRKHHQHDAENQHRVAEKVETAAILDHEY
jgi:hypothetical protein